MSDFADIAFSEYNKTVPDAFHGTSLDVAKTVIKTKVFVPSEGDELYLGDGVYFFESADIGECVDWAVRHGRTPPAVIKAFIKLEKCLDFHNQRHVGWLAMVREGLCSHTGGDVKDAAAINTLAGIAGAYIVRSPYTQKNKRTRKPDKVYRGSRLYQKSSIYLCVREQNVIIDLEIVFGE